MSFIKINLLGLAAPKPKAKPVAPAQKSMLQVWIFLGALVVSFGIVGLMYLIWSGSIDKLNVELKKQQAEQTRLVAIRQENARYEGTRAQLELRVKAVQLLQTSRVGPTEFMGVLGSVVAKTPTDLFFASVTNDGGRVAIQGQAGSANSVATLLALLKSSGSFDDVQLRQFYEDDKPDFVSYKFSLDGSYKPPSAATTATQASAGAATPQRPGM
ncbi:MAG: PilN domain-containing protein [Terriglobia bacterium]|jgi:Tfp pilus assembly protein PilN